MARASLAVVMMLGLLGVGRAQAEQTGAMIAESGTPAGVPPCGSCHGARGEGNAETGFPRLAGLAAAYLEAQLAAFASGQRDNPVMTPVAKLLSGDEARTIAAYYAQLSGLSPPKATPAAASPGAILALEGRWSDGIPACVSCHGPGGMGVGASFPPLLGQPASYLQAQLEAWQQGKRPPGPLGLMGSVAKRLAANEVADVAAWFANLASGEGK